MTQNERDELIACQRNSRRWLQTLAPFVVLAALAVIAVTFQIDSMPDVPIEIKYTVGAVAAFALLAAVVAVKEAYWPGRGQ